MTAGNAPGGADAPPLILQTTAAFGTFMRVGYLTQKGS